MSERTTSTRFGNLVTYAGIDTLDDGARKAVESAQGGQIDGIKSYANHIEAAKHTAYVSANRVHLFRTARPVPLDRP